MRLCHPPDGRTSPKYKLLCFITTTNFCIEKNALAFNRDRCCTPSALFTVDSFPLFTIFKACCSIVTYVNKTLFSKIFSLFLTKSLSNTTDIPQSKTILLKALKCVFSYHLVCDLNSSFKTA